MMKKISSLWWFVLSFLLIVYALSDTKNSTTPNYSLITSVEKISPTLATQKVFFRSTETDTNGFVSNYLIASMDLTYEMTLNAKWSDMNLSTDGRYLVYTTSIEANNEEIHMLDLLTNEDVILFDTSRIPGNVTYLGVEDPSLSADMEKVIFRVNITDEKFGLGLYSIKNDSIQIITTEGFNSRPKFSANEKKILSICEGKEAVGFQICIMESDGSNTVLLYDKKVHFLTFSTDGKDVVFCPSREKEDICEGIFVIDLDGLNLRKLTYFDEEFLSKWK